MQKAGKGLADWLDHFKRTMCAITTGSGNLPNAKFKSLYFDQFASSSSTSSSSSSFFPAQFWPLDFWKEKRKQIHTSILSRLIFVVAVAASPKSKINLFALCCVERVFPKYLLIFSVSSSRNSLYTLKLLAQKVE